MEEKLVEKINGICEEYYEKTVDLLSRVIACKSYSGHEGDCADLLKDFFKENEIPVFVDSRGSLLAVSTPFSEYTNNEDNAKQWVTKAIEDASNNNAKILIYNAHMDVVSADNSEEWTDDPFKAVRREGKIFGRGTCDMKGALAAMAYSLVLTKALDKVFKRKVVLLGCFVTEEEVSEGMAFKDIFEEFGLKADMVLLGEPSKMQISRGQRGKLEMCVETTGVCSHTSVPETAVSAVYKLADVLKSVEKYELDERAKYGLDAENTLNRTTLAVASIESWPKNRSFVPDRAAAYVTGRLALGQSMKSICDTLEKHYNWPEGTKCSQFVYRGESYKGKKSEWVSEHQGWETKKDSAFFKLVSEAFKAITGKEPINKIWPFSTDGVYSASRAGIPTLGLGPGYEEMAHKIDEWVKEEDFKLALKLYTLIPFYSEE
ncbi:MAG: M20/M25/M40 family metallo-hydrolase [Candidatus Riflebacteria bacterium]|nr:M20/M25/M40 family metallo-hydrolase [Candidatus Riflebacteria bacterium]